MILAFGLLLSTLLNDKLVKTKLLRGALEHPLLDTALCNEAEHIHLLRLSDSVSAVHSLQVGLGIPAPAVSTFYVRSSVIEDSPITIIKNDNVCSCQVNAKTSRASSQQKDELLAIRFIVLVDCDDSVVVRRATIDAAVLWEQKVASKLLQLLNGA